MRRAIEFDFSNKGELEYYKMQRAIEFDFSNKGSLPEGHYASFVLPESQTFLRYHWLASRRTLCFTCSSRIANISKDISWSRSYSDDLMVESELHNRAGGSRLDYNNDPPYVWAC
ncbi:hypothetical protein HNY73_018771 [Argiope bruennichi]|uniref:Uncharacterized protein n=1 Tax=Argiope bruennichi TaxID=94029 RepID=A0A8T0EHD7_ARGBR|nr:hypothetical protein HNY73_018771 [Argiope bruennichi]